MKRAILSILFLVTVILLNAQTPTFKWAKAFSGYANVWGRVGGIANDPQGNVYILGNFNDSIDLDPSVGVSMVRSNGLFISKLDSAGHFIWGKTLDIGINYYYSLSHKSIAVGSDGAIYVAGFFNGTVDFDPGIGVFNLTGRTSENDLFLLKLDSSGNFIRAQAIMGTASGLTQATISDAVLAVDASSNTLVAASFSGIVDLDPGTGTFNTINEYHSSTFIVKLDSTGAFTWGKVISDSVAGYSDCRAFDIVTDKYNNIYACGGYRGKIDVDPGPNLFILSSPVPTYSAYCTYSLKLNAQGNFVWANTTSGQGYTSDYGRISVGLAGDIYLAGGFDGTISFPGVNTNFTIVGNMDSSDIYIAKMDSVGKFLWVKTAQESANSYNFVTAINTDALGAVYAVGQFNHTVDFDPDTGVYNLSANKIGTFAMKLSKAGNFEWAGGIQGTGYSFGEAMSINEIGDIYIAGHYYQGDSVDYDPGLDSFNITSSTVNGLFLTKWWHGGMIATNVWPGDANADGIAENTDILTIGQMYGATGLARTNASLVWTAQPAYDWNDTLPNGVNAKHADCDGNGVINAADTSAVSLNYGLTHQKHPNSGGPNDPPIYLAIPNDTVNAGQTISIPVMLGTTSQTVSNIYGVAFAVDYNSALIDSNSIQFTADNSWLGTAGTDLLLFHKNIPAMSQTALAMVRTNHTNVSGQSQIGTISYTIKQGVTGLLPISIINVKAIQFNGTDVPLSYGATDTIFVKLATGIAETESIAMQVVPNPTNGKVEIRLSAVNGNATIEVYNSIGALVQQQTTSTQISSIDLSNEANGLYVVKVRNADGSIASRKIVKQ